MSPRRVVIAEDETLIRLDLADLLTEEGYTVVGQATTGDHAIALATELRPDLVLMDVLLPRTDGITATANLTVNRISPVLMLAATSQPTTLVDRARDAGAMAYVTKPFTKATLLPAIEMSIARYADTTALRDQVTLIRERLENRKVIERAKGLLMANRGMTEPNAFRWLQRTAMDHRTSMLQVATAVIDKHHPPVATGPAAHLTGVTPTRDRRARSRPGNQQPPGPAPMGAAAVTDELAGGRHE